MPERLLTDYVWVWLTGLAMVILYPVIALTIWGLARGSINQTTYAVVARKLLLCVPYISSISHTLTLLHSYPIIYNFCILPNSTARWLTFTNHNVPDRIVLAANAIHALSGFFDLVVFAITRPALVFGTRCDTLQQNHHNFRGFPRAVTTNKRPPHFLAADTPDLSPTSSQHDSFDRSFHTRRPVMSESEV